MLTQMQSKLLKALLKFFQPELYMYNCLRTAERLTNRYRSQGKETSRIFEAQNAV